MPSIAKLLQNLSPDVWRQREEFSQDVAFCNRQILDGSKSDEEISVLLRDWLAINQPCFFGRMASGALDLLSFCILRENDLAESDAHIRDKIKRFRLQWKREAFLGRRSGFIILAVSRRIVEAEPNEAMKELAKRLCFLYLREEIKEDEIHMDRLTLEVAPTPENPGESSFYEWFVGVNVFATAGDKRWWHDHRIPGGIGFSMNSVGHMARNGSLHRLAEPGATGLLKPLQGRLGIDSLGTALKFAMLTINGAQDAPGGKATCLRRLDQQEYNSLTPKCPFAHAVPPKLQLMNYKDYDGWYHTDVTVPSDYFHPDVNRPAAVVKKKLDFTYLFDDSIENPAYETTGLGGQIQ
jgi:hypothetical protein